MAEENKNMGGDAKPMDQNKVMAVLAYIGPLLVISYIIANKDPMVKFHIKQGLVLLVIEAGLWVIGAFLFSPFGFGVFASVLNLIRLAVAVLAVLGIINVVQDKQKELPLVGQFAKYFNI